MSDVCILTDSTVQFVQPSFPGRERVHIIPFSLQLSPRPLQPGEGEAEAYPLLTPASPQDFLQYYSQLSHRYGSILVLTISSFLSRAMENALAASAQFSNHCTVQVIDSQTVGAGLGMLVQAAATAAARGLSLAEIERKIRIAIPHIYILFCIPELMYLAAAGHMDRSQAMVGEILSMLPVFTLEEGRLVPSEKVRTPRHLFEAFQDFMAEFESPAHIALVHGSNHNSLRIRPLRQYLQELFPQTPFSEHSLQPQLTALFGPQSIGLFVSEIEE
jgi:DegV family protein with EDD domain